MTYPTVSDLKADLGISSSGDDTKLGIDLAAAIKYAEMTTSRVFVAATATRTFPVQRPFVDASRRVLFLKQEICSIDAWVIDGKTMPTSDYFLESIDGLAPFSRVRLYPGSPYRIIDSTGKTPMSVTGDWGYSTSCPDDLFGAILDLAKWMYRSSSSGTGGAITAGSRRGGLTVEAAKIPGDLLTIIKGYERAF